MIFYAPLGRFRMRLSPRRILRVILSVLIIAVLWLRAAQEWRERAGLWMAGSLILSVLLILIVIVELTGLQQKWRRQRDEVPKRPLGLDS
jgi:hypothetical protein